MRAPGAKGLAAGAPAGKAPGGETDGLLAEQENVQPPSPAGDTPTPTPPPGKAADAAAPSPKRLQQSGGTGTSLATLTKLQMMEEEMLKRARDRQKTVDEYVTMATANGIVKTNKVTTIL